MEVGFCTTRTSPDQMHGAEARFHRDKLEGGQGEPEVNRYSFGRFESKIVRLGEDRDVHPGDRRDLDDLVPAHSVPLRTKMQMERFRGKAG